MKKLFKSSKEKNKKPENYKRENKVKQKDNFFNQDDFKIEEEAYYYDDTYISKASKKPNVEPAVIPAAPNVAQASNAKVPGQNIIQGKPVNSVAKQPYVYSPRIIEKKLTIILVEDTAEMTSQEAMLSELYTRCKSDILTVIHYGEKIRITETEIHNKFFKKNNDEEVKCFKFAENAGEKACFSDALLAAVKIISENYNKIKEKNFIKTKISDVEIIGIGTCKDNCSIASREKAILDFCKMLNTTNIMSKYLCLTEDYFFEAAEFGFRSIGSISKVYQ